MAWRIETHDVLGELKLQGNDYSNIFFADEVHHNNTGREHPRVIGTFHGTFPSQNLDKSEGYKVNLPIENTVLQGFYIDRFLLERAVQGTYEIFISIWYEEE